MTRNRVAAGFELAFAIAVTLCAVGRPSLWHEANSARVFVLVEAAGAAYIARGLMNARAKAWLAAFVLSVVGVAELWLTSAAFVFSYMGEGSADRPGLLLLMGCFSLQAIVLLLYMIERLALWRRAINSYDSHDSAR